jgi:hypothetical protein
VYYCLLDTFYKARIWYFLHQPNPNNVEPLYNISCIYSLGSLCYNKYKITFIGIFDVFLNLDVKKALNFCAHLWISWIKHFFIYKNIIDLLMILNHLRVCQIG